MDAADLNVHQQGLQAAGRKADPLTGIDVEREYKMIKAGFSALHPRIQSMVVNRWELGC